MKNIPDTQPDFYHPDTFNRGDSIGYLIKILHIHMSRSIDSEVADLDLTSMQWRPLMVLGTRQSPCTITELASCLEVDNAAVTRMIDRLDAKGLVERERCGIDRRVIYVHLTEAGKAILNHIPERLARGIGLYLTDISPEEFTLFKSIIHKMLANGQVSIK